MSIPMNKRLLHQMQGNSQLAQYILCRFQENYPMLLQLFAQAWNQGDASALHAIGARMTSHLRVVGLDDDVAALQQLLDNKGAGSILQEQDAWRQLQFETLCPEG
jgi:hypothetical protein